MLELFYVITIDIKLDISCCITGSRRVRSNESSARSSRMEEWYLTAPDRIRQRRVVDAVSVFLESQSYRCTLALPQPSMSLRLR